MKHEVLMFSKSESMVDKALSGLLELVLASETGARIPSQPELALKFGVSRTVLREAISRLLLLNVITVRPKTGTTVNAPDRWMSVNADVLKWRLKAGESKEKIVESTVSAARECVGA